MAMQFSAPGSTWLQTIAEMDEASQRAGALQTGLLKQGRGTVMENAV